MPRGYRAIAAVKWTSLGVFPVVNRRLQSELGKEFLFRCVWITGEAEVIPLRRESAPVHLIVGLNIPGALGETQ